MSRRGFVEITAALSVALVLAVEPAVAAEYKLGTLDRVKIKVQEWPDLNGEYAVTADGFISVPLIGNIQVAGAGLSDLTREISDRLQRRADGAERPVAAAEIIQYRPFSILGDVQRPGDYPYRPGLTVLGAIAMAGGYYRPELGLLRLDRDIALAKGEIRSLLAKQNRLLARQARLTAALAGREKIDLPSEFVDQKDNPLIASIMEGEQSALALERDRARSESAALENIKSLYRHEIDSLHGQVDALAQERESIQDQLKQFHALSAKGLALAPTTFALERSLAQVVNEQMSMGTAIVKAEESITLAGQQFQEHSLDRLHADRRDLQQTTDDLVEVRARIRTNGDLLTEAQISAPAEARERLSERGQRSSFVLIRKDGDATHEIAADEMTPVLPDDVLKVPMIRSEPQASGKLADVSQAENSGKADP